jgi:hypothetical protein
MTVERFDRFEQIKQQTADAAGLPIDNDRVNIVAALRFAHRLLVEEMVSGKLDSEKLLGLSRAISELTPPPVEPPIVITVKFV